MKFIQKLKNLKDKVGATTVEFALIGATSIYLLFGIIDLSVMYFTWSALQASVDVAARETLVSSTPTASTAISLANQYAINAGYVSNGASLFNFTNTASVACGTITCINVVGNYNYVFKFLSIGRASVNLTAQSYAPILP